MNDGFVKLAVAVPPLRVADCGYNAGQIIRLARDASNGGAVIAVFPELCVTGNSCSDLFFHSALLDGAEKALGNIAAATEGLDTLSACRSERRANYTTAARCCKPVNCSG